MAELNQAISIITSSAFPKAKAIWTYLTRLNVKLQGISRDLDQAARSNVSETIDKLEVALERLYELAVFIRGDYDNREPDEISKGNLFHQLRQEFEEVEARAHRGLKEIGDLHNQVMETQSMVITPIKNTLSLMTQNNHDELAITLSKISSTQQSIQTFDQSICQQEDAVRTLQSKTHLTSNPTMTTPPVRATTRRTNVTECSMRFLIYATRSRDYNNI
ncbi:hypothetical protein BGW80DRAFT_1354589 [Lactifluus volemus]|nr:hypothetical protein BGW80DRAFT_1354589 [Lactifluus volemus]